jgi:formate dehydrogenase major subunit
LGTSFGRGGATTFQQDLQNADCILNMGSNMAENHPIGFQWVMEARERGATFINVDPRFTRTSAMSTMHVPIRPGTDIALLGGIIRYILEHDRAFKEYVVNYTNAPVILREEYVDAEDLDGFFSGWDSESRGYKFETWMYRGMDLHGAAGQRESEESLSEEKPGAGNVEDALRGGEPPYLDKTLQHPHCVYQVLKHHYRRYTPETVAEICGITPQQVVDVALALCDNSGPDKTSAIAYSVAWTQHTFGVQMIRAAAIVQLLLGNVGRPGGGILALRGHASIQGSTDIPTLFDLLPGYIPMPHAKAHSNLAHFCETEGSKTGFWGNLDSYMVSLLKAWFGENARPDNEYLFDLLPRISGDHSTYRSIMGMLDGKVKGFFICGENPAVGSANSGLHRRALANLEWLVVRDFSENESAAFWYDSPEIESGALQTEKIPTEIFWMPAAAHTEKDGSFTNTQRLLQWHHKAVEPRCDARSELWFYYHLGKRIKAKLAQRDEPNAELVEALTWTYPEKGALREPDAHAVLREINGWDAGGKALSAYTELKSDGSTACGCWIYCGSFKNEKNQTANRTPVPSGGDGPGSERTWVAPEWGWAWPANRRLLYNRASADPAGRPWSDRKKYVWWDEAKGEWTGYDVPDFEKTKRPDYTPPKGAQREAALAGWHPFIMQEDGLGWLFAPNGIVDGPLPTYFEPLESPVRNPLYAQQTNPCMQRFPRRHNEYNPSPSDEHGEIFPFVLHTYRLTEHHTAGGMSRTVPHLTELQPEFFCEVSPELAAMRGLQHGGWATIFTMRAVIEARVMVTRRAHVLRVNGRTVHTVGLPYHWGRKGLSTGDAANDLLHIALDPNVHIQETKGLTCDIRPGRRPRGRAMAHFMEDLHARVRAAEKTARPS